MNHGVHAQSPRGKPLRAGLLGRGIEASRSPGMHEAEGARLGLDYTYRRFDFDALGLADSELPHLLDRLRTQGYCGLNITYPFKERVIEHLDGLSSDAAAIGAVNTVAFRDGDAKGHNTDSWGWRESFRRNMAEAALDNVVVVGAGGAGLAVVHALLDLGAGRVDVFDLDHQKAARLAEQANSRFGAGRVVPVERLDSDLAGVAGLVNASPVGMGKYPGTPVDVAMLRADLWVADVVYFPIETELLAAARRIGCRTMSGAGMAILQAVRAFELITGFAADPEQMATHFDATHGLAQPGEKLSD